MNVKTVKMTVMAFLVLNTSYFKMFIIFSDNSPFQVQNYIPFFHLVHKCRRAICRTGGPHQSTNENRHVIKKYAKNFGVIFERAASVLCCVSAVCVRVQHKHTGTRPHGAFKCTS